VKRIIGFDFNALYGGINGLADHLGGIYCIREKHHHYKPDWPFEISNKNRGVSTWLQFRQIIDKTTIQSALNEGEKCVMNGKQRLFVDGYSECTNTVYEYLGCFWHSHLNHFDKLSLNGADDHPIKKSITHLQNYQETMERITFLKKEFDHVMISWECEWLRYLKNNEGVHVDLVSKLLPSFAKSHSASTEEKIIEEILHGNIFGICFCDVSVPPHLQEQHVEFPPVYVKIQKFSVDDLTEPMKSYAVENNLTPPSSFLTTQMHGKNLVLPTEIVQFYIEEGFTVSNVTKIIQYEPGFRPFEKFLNDRVKERRDGDKNGASVISHMAKLLQNAAVG